MISQAAALSLSADSSLTSQLWLQSIIVVHPFQLLLTKAQLLCQRCLRQSRLLLAARVTADAAEMMVSSVGGFESHSSSSTALGVKALSKSHVAVGAVQHQPVAACHKMLVTQKRILDQPSVDHSLRAANSS
jgi:hypothetical protein